MRLAVLSLENATQRLPEAVDALVALRKARLAEVAEQTAFANEFNRL
jgi:hypothetical protein